MPKLRNINPLGQVDVPLLRRQGEPLGEEGVGCLEPGEVFEASPKVAEHLLEQSDNFELVKAAPRPRKAAKKSAAPKPAATQED